MLSICMALAWAWLITQWLQLALAMFAHPGDWAACSHLYDSTLKLIFRAPPINWNLLQGPWLMYKIAAPSILNIFYISIILEKIQMLTFGIQLWLHFLHFLQNAIHTLSAQVQGWIYHGFLVRNLFQVWFYVDLRKHHLYSEITITSKIEMPK